MRTTVLLLCLFLTPLALADVVHLKNGRKLEGEIVKQTADAVHLRLRRGKMVLPRDLIQRIVERIPPQRQLAEWTRKADMGDHVVVENLSLWASKHGLGEQAQDLAELARGLELQERVAEAQTRPGTRAFLDVFRWGRRSMLEDEVLRWLLERARSYDPDDPELAVEARRFEAYLAKKRARQAKREQHTPSWYPKEIDPYNPKWIHRRLLERRVAQARKRAQQRIDKAAATSRPASQPARQD